MKFAVKVDNKEVNEIPGRKNESGTYYSVKADCGGSTKAEWDYNAWNLKVDNIQSNSKCSLTFTSNLNEEDYKKYIEAGISLRRNTYRGKDITNYKNLSEEEPMNLYNQISSCTFDDIYVGDYITGSNEVTWLIADLNNYLNSGDTENTKLTKCHATIIPADSLENSRMNSTSTTDGGYLNSEMKKTTLPKILTKYVFQDFLKEHVLTYKTVLSNGINDNRYNRFGITGATNGWQWIDSQIDLMSEINVYGSIIASSSVYDIGIDNHQYAIFQLRPNLINNTKNWYWLKAVATSKTYVQATYGSVSASYDSIDNGGIRPRFLIG